MNILEQIEKVEQSDIDQCRKCEHYMRYDGSCIIYGEPNYGVSVCRDFELSEFWETKRGY